MMDPLPTIGVDRQSSWDGGSAHGEGLYGGGGRGGSEAEGGHMEVVVDIDTESGRPITVGYVSSNGDLVDIDVEVS